MAKRIRPVVIDGDIVRVPLTRGLEAVVDLADIALVEGRNWCASDAGNTFYAVSAVAGSATSGRTTLQMHRAIMGFEPGDPEVDHRDGDGLNNRRSNLREATSAQNQANQRPQAARSSRFKGVCWNKWSQRWMAQINVDGRQRHLGRFADEVDAARAYDAAALETWGEFAHLNFPTINP